MADSKSTDAFPPGFRFHPSEQQLLSYYLSNKKANPAIPGGYDTIRELSDLRGREPSELQNWSCYSYGYKGRKRHWYFYTAGVSAEEKNTKQGCWKRKGKVRDVFSRQGVVLGARTSFVYYYGSPDTASPTAWVLYQYALANHVEGSFVLCRIFSRSDSDFNSCANNDEVLMPKPETVSTTSNEQARVSQSRPAAAATPSPIQASVPPSSLLQFFDLTGPLVILPSWPAQGPRPRGASMPYYGGPMIRQGQQPPVPPPHNIAPGVYHLPPGDNMPELLAPLPGYFLPPVPPVQSLPRSVPTVLTTALVNATPEERRNMLGEELFPLVEMWEKDKAAKVTGTLLEMDNPEILHLLESPEALRAKIAEAKDVLATVAADGKQ